MRFRFADCELDVEAHELRRSGKPVHVESQVFDLIAMLAEAGGDLVRYEALNARVWQGRIVSDATLAARISAARAAVGDDGKRQAVIRTVPRRGIQMATDVVRAPRDGDVSVPQRPMPIRYVRSGDGMHIAYATNGRGPPLIRIGHWLTHVDLDWTSPVWRPLLDRLGRHHTVYRYDQRGTGLSDRAFSRVGIDAFVGDLTAVADAAGPGKLAIFVASQGVAVACRFAAENPDRVSRLVLYAGFAQGRNHRGSEVARQEAKASLALVRTGWGQPESPFLKLFTQLYVPSATPEQIAHLADMQLASVTGEGAAELRDIVDGTDVSDCLAEIRAPVLLMHGRKDAVQPMSQSEMMARRIRGAVFIPLETDNHVPLPHTAAWETLMCETEQFLAEAG